MAKSKEYQVRIAFKCRNITFSSTNIDYSDYDIANNYYMNRLNYYKNEIDSIDIEYGISVTIELIQILDNGESIILKSHGYGEIPKEKQPTT